MNNIFLGSRYMLDGFGIIIKPGIKRFVIIPFLVNLFLFISLFFLLRYYMHTFNQWFSQFLPVWLHWLTLFFWLLFFISFILVFIYVFITIANLIAAPFNSLLAEKVELFLTGRLPPSKGLFATIKDSPRILGRQLAIIGFYLPRALLCLILFLVPVIHIFAAAIWFLFNAWFMSLTYIDYPSDNQLVSLKEMRNWLSEHRWTTLGFGITALITTMIPIINFVAIPAAVAGATKFWIEARSQAKDPALLV